VAQSSILPNLYIRRENTQASLFTCAPENSQSERERESPPRPITHSAPNPLQPASSSPKFSSSLSPIVLLIPPSPMPPYTSSQAAAMSNFTRVPPPPLLLKGLCSNFNADIFCTHEKKYFVYYIVSGAEAGCVSYLRAENILSIHHRIHTLLLLRAQVPLSLPAASRTRWLFSLEIGEDGNSSNAPEFASENTRPGTPPSCAQEALEKSAFA
jgi:hypothetical protein